MSGTTLDYRRANAEPEMLTIRARDGVELVAAVYKPQAGGPFPALFAASPYRFDSNTLPASAQFLWRETGPIDFYLEQGYAYVHMDVRGSGRSGGEYEMFGRREQDDLYDAIEAVAAQSWCTGKVGSVGQSYYCMIQWFLGRVAPPSLVCIGAHDGLADLYRAGCYHGGILCDFFPGYWWYQNRFINQHPANDQYPREQKTDLYGLFSAHPCYDEFWRERSGWEVLDQIRVPLYSVAVPSKMFLHTRGNIDGFRRAQGPKKLYLSGALNGWDASAEFASPEFHERIWLPFYDHYLKGKDTNFSARPPVEYNLRGTGIVRQAQAWPPEWVEYKTFFLSTARSESVDSLNDGSLANEALTAGEASYNYPDPGWISGVVGFGAKGPQSGFDPVRRVLTFTTKPLDRALEIAGPIKLTLFASSTATDTDFFIKICDQAPQSAEERAQGINPRAEVVTRGWLRASHRALDADRSTEMEPYHTHMDPEPIEPGRVYRFDISIEPNAWLFRAGHRIRLEIVNGDSPVTEVLWPHYYRPGKIGCDTIHVGGDKPSTLVLPVTT